MGILDDIYRRRLEACNGRIFTRPGNWVFNPTKAQIKRTVAKNPHAFMEGTDANGRKMFLIKQRSIICLNPDVAAAAEYPKSPDSGGWFMPLSHCQKCEHYCKSTRKRHYPTCAWLRQRRGGAAGALESTARVYTDAIKLTNEIIRR